MAWDGIHLTVEWKNHKKKKKNESNVFQNNWNIVQMDVKPKYKQSCTYPLAGTCNKAENFQRILWTRQSAEWGNLYHSFWEADLHHKGQAGAGIMLNKTLNLQVSP